MGTFTVKTRHRTAAAGGALSTESNAIAYRCRWLMNQPSEAIVTLNDAAYAATQQYTVIGALTYLGYCTPGDDVTAPMVQIEEPTGTTVFQGNIVRAVPQPRLGTVDLHCRDFLHQYEGPKIIYDTRDELTVAGLRESTCYRMDAANEHGIVLSGGNYRLYDTIANWAENTWTGSQHYLCFSSKMGGTTSFWHGIGAISYTTAHEDDGFEHSWFGTAAWQFHAAAAGDDARGNASTYAYIPYGNIDSIDLDLQWGCTASTVDRFYIEIYNFRNSAAGPAAAYYVIYDTTEFSSGMPTVQKSVHLGNIGSIIGLSDPGGDLVHPDDHYVLCIIHAVSKAGQNADCHISLFRLTFHTSGQTVDTTAYPIDDDLAGCVIVSENLITAHIDKQAPYSITKPLTWYVQDLATTYDTCQTIDAVADLTASTNAILRHFHYMTPLAILQELAKADGTEFWLDVDLDLHWRDGYVVAGAPALTDSDVLYWLNTEVGILDAANQAVVLGQRSTTEQVTGTDTTATSDAYYGTYTVVEENPNIYTALDATTEAGLLLDRLDTPRFLIGYAVNGFSTRVVGTVVNVASTQLNIPNNTYYVVTEKRYDTRQGLTEFTLTLRSTTGLFAPRKLEDGSRWITACVEDAKRNVDYAPLHTEVWT